MTARDLIGMYLNAHALSEQMLAASINKKWEELIELEQRYTELIEQLRAKDVAPIDDADFNSKKAELVKSMLENSEKVQAATRDWMNELQSSMSSTSLEIKLNRAYFSDQF